LADTHFAQSPVRVPNDLKKHKLFVWADEGTDIEMYKTLGLSPVPLAATDLTIALQTSMVTAFSTTPLLALGNQWFAGAKHMTDVKWAPLMGATIIQKKVWDQIPPNIQELILTASKEAEIELTEEIRKLDDKAVEVMSEYGLIAHKITDEEYAEWEAIVKTVYPYIRGRIVPEEAFDRVVRLRDDFRANRLSN